MDQRAISVNPQTGASHYEILSTLILSILAIRLAIAEESRRLPLPEELLQSSPSQ